jgi:hypothetical protein
MNLVEVWFGISERQAIHRGTVTSAPEFTRKIRTFIDGWNDRSHPFTWTKTADQILTKANRQHTSETAPQSRMPLLARIIGDAARLRTATVLWAGQARYARRCDRAEGARRSPARTPWAVLGPVWR